MDTLSRMWRPTMFSRILGIEKGNRIMLWKMTIVAQVEIPSDKIPYRMLCHITEDIAYEIQNHDCIGQSIKNAFFNGVTPIVGDVKITLE